MMAPCEPVIENDLPLDLSCNSRRSTGMSDGCPLLVMDGSGDIHHPPSPPRSPADFRTLDLAYVDYQQQLTAKERHRHWQCNRDSNRQDAVIESPIERDSCSPCGQDSDDSDSQPMDLGANPKAYKKSLMKRYCK